MRTSQISVLVTSLLIVTSTVAAQQGGNAELAAEARTILKASCYGCHGKDGAVEGGLSYILDREQLVLRRQIAPGAATNSRLIRRVQKQEMPPPGEGTELTKEQIATLTKWDDAGAPDFDSPKPRSKFVSASDMVQAMLDDVQKADAADRPFRRYLTLTHLYNAGRSDDELLSFEHGISKLINSLSWGRKVVPPHRIAGLPLILRIDIRDYKWSAAIWETLASAEPFALTFSNMPAAKNLYEQTSSSLPYIRGDWFVAKASRPPLYHTILQLPDTDLQLEALLHADVEENIRTNQAARAGFNGSAVSRNNRLIERHETSYGYYWKSYDFAKNVDRQNLFSHPLGPGATPAHFRHDGGELIFSLPNGLQGYLLVDAQGRRIDKGPLEIVSDPKQPDRAVENGLSCMSCHVRGIIPKDDQIRAHAEKNPTAFSKKELESILAMYIEPKRFQALIDGDEEKFRSAVRAAGLPSSISEPIMALTRLFEAEIDLTLAAAEASVQPDDFRQALTRNPALARELGNLATPGGTVQRETFISSFGALARVTKIGTPRSKPAVLAALQPATSGQHKEVAWIELGGKNKFPALFQLNKAVSSAKNGMTISGRNYVVTKKGDYLSKDFKFELVYTLNSASAKEIMFVGLGEADRNTAYNESKNSVFLKIHPPNVDGGAIALANSPASNLAGVGAISKEGTHRVTIEKVGEVVTFAIDVDNDGASDDDIEKIIPDIKAIGSFLHNKNTYIFFGGGGTFTRFRFSSPDKTE
ncbi:MAG: c-type cytochrome domain-containing protein [Planctomycetota bacterium]